MIRRRCAIYTRKSTEEGLEQSFNSLDAQREACAAYISSQRHEGWTLVEGVYDDGGFSGGSMERPGLGQLLDDVRAGRVDVVVVYKVDRLTRSLTDFARMVEVFDTADVSFVSVTQAFNTTNSMGRLTLNVLLSFAQFEREVTAERIRDKVAASKRKGIWMGGAVPIGYDVSDNALIVNPGEATTVRLIFREYLALGSAGALRARLAGLGVVSKERTDRHGRVTGGAAFSRGALYYLLRNPVYTGKVRHKGELFDGLHEAIIDDDTWMSVKKMLDGNGGKPTEMSRSPAKRCLDGILFDREGRPMRTTYAMRRVNRGDRQITRRYFYYVSKISDAAGKAKPDRIPSGQIEEIVGAALAERLADRMWVSQQMTKSGSTVDLIADGLAKADASIAELRDNEDQSAGFARMSAQMIDRIDLTAGGLKICLRPDAFIDSHASGPATADDWSFCADFRQHQNGRARPIVLRAANGVPCRDPDLIALVADARRWMAELLSGQVASVQQITERESLRKGAVSRILPLAYLAPDIASAILEGRQPMTLTAKKLRELKMLPGDWERQRTLLGCRNL